MRKQINVLSRKEFLILDLLSSEETPVRSINLVRKSNSELKLGTIYCMLQRMELEGLVESSLEDEVRVYYATDRGLRVLDQNTLRPLDKE